MIQNIHLNIIKIDAKHQKRIIILHTLKVKSTLKYFMVIKIPKHAVTCFEFLYNIKRIGTRNCFSKRSKTFVLQNLLCKIIILPLNFH